MKTIDQPFSLTEEFKQWYTRDFYLESDCTRRQTMHYINGDEEEYPEWLYYDEWMQQSFEAGARAVWNLLMSETKNSTWE